jgi:alpha-N-arabinofuranosidase
LRYEKKAPQDAADEVEYFNGSIHTPMGALRAKNGHPAPYNLKFWQIGNERWGEAYWNAVPEFAKAILKIDPSVKLLTSFPSGQLISLAAPYVHYVSPHQYDVADLNGSQRELAETRDMIRNHAKGKPIKVAVTEWNTTAGDAGLPRAMLWDLNNALACSRYHNLLHRQADLVEIANRSNLTNSFCSGIIQTNRSSLFLTPTYYAQWLYSNLAGSRPLRVDSNLPIDLSPDISSTLSEDGRTLTVFFVNQSTTDQTRQLDLTQFGVKAKTIQVWTLRDRAQTGEPDAVNSFQDPVRISPRQSSITMQSGRVSYKFPGLSLTVMRCSAL